jgi:hypothetical protein
MKNNYFVELSPQKKLDFAQSIFSAAKQLNLNVYVVRRKTTIHELWTNRKNLTLFRNRMNVFTFQPERSDEGVIFFCGVRSWHMNTLHAFLAKDSDFKEVLRYVSKTKDIVAAEIMAGCKVPIMIDFLDEDAYMSAEESISPLIAQLFPTAVI